MDKSGFYMSADNPEAYKLAIKAIISYDSKADQPLSKADDSLESHYT